MLMQELGGNARPTTVYEKVHKQNKDRQANHELQIFSFESISVATSNFSSENKLGEGGFGLVYKVSSLHLSLSLSVGKLNIRPSLANPTRPINKLTLELSSTAQ